MRMTAEIPDRVYMRDMLRPQLVAVAKCDRLVDQYIASAIRRIDKVLAQPE